MNVLLIDNFDSFTYLLKDYIEQSGGTCTVFRNDVSLDLVNPLAYDALVISPGPGTPFEAGNTMEILSLTADKMPILGVCLGHQAIGVFYGANLCNGLKPMHGKVSLIQHNDDELFLDLPTPFKATRYHSLVIKELPVCLNQIATSADDNEVMAISHKELPIYGIQFHPESCLSEGGLTLIQNFLGLASLSKQG
jgi:anthranilate synthase component 2